MAAYKATTTGWPDNPRVKLLTRKEIKHLVSINQWHKLGQVFNFIPVFHFEGNRFLDWRCVPQALLDILKEKPIKHFPSKIHEGVIKNMNRVQKRNQIRSLMLKADWAVLEKVYGFKPRFVKTPIGKHVIDWTCLPWNVHEILKCGGTIKPTPYTLEGGIYDPKEKPKKEYQPHLKKFKKDLVSQKLRTVRQTLEERIPIRQRLYEQQEGICHYCKVLVPKSPESDIFISRFWSIDHRLPISRGGTNEEANLIGACNDCNSNKSWLTEEEFFRSDFLIQKLENLEAAKNMQSNSHNPYLKS